MRRKTIRIISLVFALITLFSACNCGGSDDNKPDSTKSKAADNSANHYRSVTETDNYVVRNGTTEYYIVYPQDVDKATADGVSELQYFFKKATGIALNAVVDSGLSHDDSRKVFSIGRTNLFKTSGLEVDEEKFGNDGHIVKTVGNTIYLVGGGYAGNLYSVYTFLEIAFNYDTYAIETYTIDEVDNLKLYNYDVVEIPDILNRRPDTDYDLTKVTDYDRAMHYNRLKVYTAKSGALPIHSEYKPFSTAGITHNSTSYLPTYVYKEQHPKWYSTAVPEDLCYTAHGDGDELEAMIEEVAKKIEYSLTLYTPKNYPNMNTAVIQKLDLPGECACDGCMAIKTTYGTQSAAVIKFVNRVALKVDEWMAKPENAEYKRIGFKVMFLAYHQFSEAPVVYNEETQAYEPIDDSVVFVKSAGVQHAPIYDFDTASSIYDEVNEGGIEKIKRWQAVCPEGSYGVWGYGMRFTRDIYFYDTFNFFNNDYFRLLYENGRAGLFFREASGTRQGTAIGFDGLEDYISSKLMWNCNADMDALMDKWFNGVFGEAAKYVQQFFNELRTHTRKTAEENGMVIINSMYYGINNKKYWPYAQQKKWLDLFDQAFEAIKPIESTDPELYKTMKKNLSAEYISPAYIMLTFYKEDLPTEERNKIIENITNAARLTNVKNINGIEREEYLKKLYE